MEDGRAAGTVVWMFGDGEELVQPLQYITVQDDGLTYGFMNGMRPRGMLLFEGRRRGDTLSGDMRFAGINARGPNGEALPTIHFEYRRVTNGSGP